MESWCGPLWVHPYNINTTSFSYHLARKSGRIGTTPNRLGGVAGGETRWALSAFSKCFALLCFIVLVKVGTRGHRIACLVFFAPTLQLGSRVDYTLFRFGQIVSLTELMAGVKAPTKTVQLFQLTCFPLGHKVSRCEKRQLADWCSSSGYLYICMFFVCVRHRFPRPPTRWWR